MRIHIHVIIHTYFLLDSYNASVTEKKLTVFECLGGIYKKAKYTFCFSIYKYMLNTTLNILPFEHRKTSIDMYSPVNILEKTSLCCKSMILAKLRAVSVRAPVDYKLFRSPTI